MTSGTEKWKRAEVTITEDPATSAPVGSRLFFEAQHITHRFEANAVWLKDWDSFDGLLLSINFADSTSHRIEGSGVLVAPGIALCATHVIKPNIEAIMQGVVGCVALAICKGYTLVWRIKKITFVPNSDLTILGMSLASPLPAHSKFNMAAISTRTPKPGESLLLTGFRASAYSFPVGNQNENKFMEYSGNVLACNGPVTKIYATARDISMLPWPTIEVDCPSFGAMSGGPVFDCFGKLVGLLSSSYDTGPSYISMVWPALVTDFEGGWPESVFVGKRSMIQIEPMLCSIDKREALTIQYDETGRYVTYRQWSE